MEDIYSYFLRQKPDVQKRMYAELNGKRLPCYIFD